MRCRQMRKAAIDDGLLERNLLTGFKIALTSDNAKNHFIAAETAKALWGACPDQEYV